MPAENTLRSKTALHWRRTKIIATLGPASSSPAMITSLIAAGVDLVRLNMSHGDHDTHRTTAQRVRRASAKAGRHVAILVDLCGPKIRVGRFENDSIVLETDSTVTVTTRKIVGSEGIIPSQYSALHKDLKAGEAILLDDGKMALKVKSISGTEIQCQVVEGGVLSNHKGMNLPDSEVSAAALTNKDREDVKLAMEMDADFVALSFVRTAKDVQQLIRYMKSQGGNIPVVSKIERPEAVENIDAIMQVSYGIMIARGDLGIELPAEKVPLIQRDLIRKARQYGVPVIVATQMLESMISQSQPTRAEVSDVAGAALLSTDAAMLSGETAAGKFPLQSVKMMDRILREVERSQWFEGSFTMEPITDRGSKLYSIRESMAHAAVQLTFDLEVSAIVVPTNTGTTARIMSAHRPLPPAVMVASEDKVCRRMNLHWGVVPVMVDRDDTTDWRSICETIALKTHLAKTGHDVLLVSGFSDDPRKDEPVLKLLHL